MKIVATIQHKSSGWYLQFRYKNQRYTLSLGPVEEVEAIGKKAKAEKLLRLIKDNLLDLPGDVDIRTFLQYDGKPPARTPEPKKEWTLGELSEKYLKICSHGA